MNIILDCYSQQILLIQPDFFLQKFAIEEIIIGTQGEFTGY